MRLDRGIQRAKPGYFCALPGRRAGPMLAVEFPSPCDGMRILPVAPSSGVWNRMTPHPKECNLDRGQRRRYCIPRRHLVILGKSLAPYLFGFQVSVFAWGLFTVEWLHTLLGESTDSYPENRMISVRLCHKLSLPSSSGHLIKPRLAGR